MYAMSVAWIRKRNMYSNLSYAFLLLCWEVSVPIGIPPPNRSKLDKHNVRSWVSGLELYCTIEILEKRSKAETKVHRAPFNREQLNARYAAYHCRSGLLIVMGSFVSKNRCCEVLSIGNSMFCARNK